MIATKPLKPRACKHCKSSFTPTKSMQVVCSPMCGLERARIQREEKERKQVAERKKVERAMDTAKRRSLETIPQLIKVAQREFNAFIRERIATSLAFAAVFRWEQEKWVARMTAGTTAAREVRPISDLMSGMLMPSARSAIAGVLAVLLITASAWSIELAWRLSKRLKLITSR